MVNKLENNLKNMNNIIRDPAVKRKMKKSRSDQLLTTMRRLNNQQNLQQSDENQNFIILPFNKASNKQPKKSPFQVLKNSNNSQFKTSGYFQVKNSNNFENIIPAMKSSHDKENFNNSNFREQDKNQKSRKTISRTKLKPVKIFINDPFDVNFMANLLAKERFMTNSIVQTAIYQR